MQHEKYEPQIADQSSPPVDPPIRPWVLGAVDPAEMTQAERRDEIIMILGKGVLRICTAGRMQAENSSS